MYVLDPVLNGTGPLSASILDDHMRDLYARQPLANVAQRTPRWYLSRADPSILFTASEFGSLLRLVGDTRTVARERWNMRHRQPAKSKHAWPGMLHGIEMEPAVMAMFLSLIPWGELYTTGMFKNESGEILASPDGLYKMDGLIYTVEAKTQWAESDAYPLAHVTQVAAQIVCTGAAGGFLISVCFPRDEIEAAEDWHLRLRRAKVAIRYLTAGKAAEFMTAPSTLKRIEEWRAIVDAAQFDEKCSTRALKPSDDIPQLQTIVPWGDFETRINSPLSMAIVARVSPSCTESVQKTRTERCLSTSGVLEAMREILWTEAFPDFAYTGKRAKSTEDPGPPPFSDDTVTAPQ